MKREKKPINPLKVKVVLAAVVVFVILILVAMLFRENHAVFQKIVSLVIPVVVVAFVAIYELIDPITKVIHTIRNLWSSLRRQQTEISQKNESQEVKEDRITGKKKTPGQMIAIAVVFLVIYIPILKILSQHIPIMDLSRAVEFQRIAAEQLESAHFGQFLLYMLKDIGSMLASGCIAALVALLEGLVFYLVLRKRNKKQIHKVIIVDEDEEE